MPGLRWPARERAATFGAAARCRYLPADRTAHRGSATASPATSRPSCRTPGATRSRRWCMKPSGAAAPSAARFG